MQTSKALLMLNWQSDILLIIPMSKRIIIISILVVAFIILLAWLFVESSKPLPGEKALQDNRNHLDEGAKTDYKFNPPTSGDHYPAWITKGFYDTSRFDGDLVHSLEHGYIVISYDCEKKLSAFSFQLSEVYAQEPATTSAKDDDQGRAAMTGGSEGTASASLANMPKAFSDGSCDNFKSKLKNLYNKFGQHKLIVTPRTGMDYPLVLAAWGRLEKLNSVDEGKIKGFIDAFRDQGPEATIEP